MATLKSDFAKGLRQLPQPSGSETVSARMQITLAAAIATSDILQFGELPDGCVVEGWTLDNDDVDTGANLALDLGILDAAGTAVSSAAANGGKWLSASTAGQAAAVTHSSAGTAAAQTALLRMTPADTKRMVGAVATVGGAGGVGNKVGLTVRYRAANGSN